MAKNLIKQVDDVKNYVMRGYPDGIERLPNDIKILLARIHELEVTLMPFARVGVQPSSQELVYVYHKDCKNAAEKMLTDKTDIPKEEEYLPAEG